MTPSPNRCGPLLPHRQQAFTLVEIIIAMALFVLVFLGLFQGVVQTRKLSQSIYLQTTAEMVANSFMAQWWTIDSVSLQEVIDTNDETLRFLDLDGSDLELEVNEADFQGPVLVPVELHPDGETRRHMELWLRLSVATPLGSANHYQKTLEYRWYSPYTSDMREGRIQHIRSIASED
ncbi:MAG: prepilin-type N-terminal cleavage/methylation domain-containing protein [Opitutales bacterium]|nr:prepilin-type N-terminal cleavage/methylation domain-containing protein [Opitutales bacterium]MCH8539416.1 prepilin-type N-terminal cleavage/methylation domain-containing protein [Opitutales bacterium]